MKGRSLCKSGIAVVLKCCHLLDMVVFLLISGLKLDYLVATSAACAQDFIGHARVMSVFNF